MMSTKSADTDLMPQPMEQSLVFSTERADSVERNRHILHLWVSVFHPCFFMIVPDLAPNVRVEIPRRGP